MPFQQLFKNIFDRDEAHPGNAAMLQQVLKEQPYFSLGHFFLLKQTDVKDAGYPKIAAKSALHFHNIFLLQSQLQQTLPTANELPHIDPDSTSPTSIELVEEVPVLQQVSESVTVEDEMKNEEPAVALMADDAPSSQAEEAQEIINAEPEPSETASIPVPDEYNKDKPASDGENKVPTLAAAAPAAEGSLLFTPLYATDYFASQGIKLREEAMPNDKLGKQLKSFTDWLKTMKKVHDNKLPDATGAVDVSVQQLAEKSNKEEAVLTESMAEVFLQQEKLHKAKEVYEKLSLLNPSKIAYFAAKIDQIQQK